MVLYYKSTFFQVREKWLNRKKNLSLQNHFSRTTFLHFSRKCSSVLLQFHEFSNYICFVLQQLPGQYSADVSVEEEVGNYLTAEVPSGSGRRGSFRGSRISSVGHSHSGSMDLMETGSLPSGFR